MEAWYKNTTSSDLLLSDLGLKIPAYKTVNLYRIKPSLTVEAVAKSRETGLLSKCILNNKLISLPAAPPPQQVDLGSRLTEAKGPIPSRVKTSVVVDIKEQDFIEDMESYFVPDETSAAKYAEYADGIADPLVLHSDDESFEVIAIPEQEQDDNPVSKGDAVETSIDQVGAGAGQYFVINPTQ